MYRYVILNRYVCYVFMLFIHISIINDTFCWSSFVIFIYIYVSLVLLFIYIYIYSVYIDYILYIHLYD